MTSDPECPFCGIVRGDASADTVLETEHAVAFRDLNPQAPVHVLVVPRAHHPDIGSLVAADRDAAIGLLDAVSAVAEQEGAGDNYRLVFNTGRGAGQSVFHCHGHVLAGRSFSWPPG